MWLAVTAALPIQQHEVDPGRVAGVDLGIIHPYAVVTDQAGLLISGRALRAENYLHLHLQDQQAHRAKAARRAPTPGQRGSRRWRRHRTRVRRMEARHRRRVHQAQHQAAKQVITFALQQRVGTLLVGDPNGITEQAAGRVHNWRLRQWRRTHLLQALRDKAERMGIAAKAGGGPTSRRVPVLVEHRRAGVVPARRDRRRHLHDRRRRSCLASGHPPDDPVSGGCRSLCVPDLAPGEDQSTPTKMVNVG